MHPAPIVLFTYNRALHTKKTIEALQQNEMSAMSDLFIFSDAAKDVLGEPLVKEVRNYLKTIQLFKSVTIIERKKNYGLATNIIEGVKQIIDQYGKIIVLEDDLITSPFFLQFMNEALDLYQNEKRVLSIHGYIYPVKKNVSPSFFLIDPGSLGWATWKDRWNKYEKDGAKLLRLLKEKKLVSKFNYDNNFPFIKMLKNQVEGKNNSWVIRWYAYALLNQLVTLYPGKSLVFHAGNDGSGTHESASDYLDVELADEPILLKKIEPVVDIEAREAFKNYFRSIRGSLLKRGMRKIKRILHHAKV